MNNNPIGILDSGVGGLTVWREIIRELPHESTIYIADSANTPYGAKTPEEIYQLAKRLVDFLIRKQAKVIVVACNTITVTCLDQLRNDYPNVPMMGAVPVVKTAAEMSEHKRIGVLSTIRTAESDYQRMLIAKYAPDCQVMNIGTDKLVPIIEEGMLNGPELNAVLHEVLKPFSDHAVDTVALGCTHYPFIRHLIETHLGSNIRLLDSGAAIGRQIHRVMAHNGVEHNTEPFWYEFYTTGNEAVMRQLLRSLNTDYLPVKIARVEL